MPIYRVNHCKNKIVIWTHSHTIIHSSTEVSNVGSHFHSSSVCLKNFIYNTNINIPKRENTKLAHAALNT